ncbi:hypothetical protein T190607A01A_11043 [Tenacibaculum sp. 190524A05c]|uniref:Uncharacterized protein n=1 Tax=Tenacibaculum platacis TaxID=3137852 RepID=A0ABM9NVG8_9FLAO
MMFPFFSYTWEDKKDTKKNVPCGTFFLFSLPNKLCSTWNKSI